MAETKGKSAASTPAKSTRKWTDIESNFVIVDDKKADNHRSEVEGALTEVSQQTFQSPNGPQTVGRYKLVDDDGNVCTVLGSTSLDDRLGFEPANDSEGPHTRAVVLGQYIRIVYAGITKSRAGREIKQYTVSVAS